MDTENKLNIDIRGLVVLYSELLLSDFSFSETKIFLYMMLQSLNQQGHRIEKKIATICKATKLSRNTVNGALKSLIKKKVIIEFPTFLEFRALSSVDTDNDLSAVDHFYALELLCKLKGKTMNRLVSNRAKMDVFVREAFSGSISQKDGCQWLATDRSLLIIYTYTGARAERKISARPETIAQQIPKNSKEKNLPPGLSPDEWVELGELGHVRKVGPLTHMVLKAFYEMGDAISVQRIEAITVWLKEVVEIYKIETEADLEWVNRVLFEWKGYYSNPKNELSLKTPYDFTSTFSKFLSNSKHR